VGGGAFPPPFPCKEGCDFLKAISIDIETFSSVDLGKSGVYRYGEGEDF